MAVMTDKVALVAGGARGIGLAIGRRLAAQGATVFFTGRRTEEVEEAARNIGTGARGLVADARAPADLERAVAILNAPPVALRRADPRGACRCRLIRALPMAQAGGVVGFPASFEDQRRSAGARSGPPGRLARARACGHSCVIASTPDPL